MHPRVDQREVESLAKTMEVKFTVSGPQIGGAKSGICFDPNDPRKRGVLERWYAAVTPLLKNYYGTGGDMNVDEIHEVIPITEEKGVWHPQEGVFTGHFKPDKPQKVRRIGNLRQGVSKIVEDSNISPDINRKYRVADLITGYGVSESVRHFYDIYGGTLEGKKVIVQGWGNVGSAAAYYITQAGATVVGIIDKVGGLIDTEGLDFASITKLFNDKDGNSLNAPYMLSFKEVNEKIWDIEADVFLPCAGSRLITQNQINRLLASGLQVISSGANVPFADPEIFYGEIAESVDERIAVIPDFIANCGMARVFAYLMSDGNIDMSDKAIFNDTSVIIKRALEATHSMRAQTNLLTATAFEKALNTLK